MSTRFMVNQSHDEDGLPRRSRAASGQPLKARVPDPWRTACSHVVDGPKEVDEHWLTEPARDKVEDRTRSETQTDAACAMRPRRAWVRGDPHGQRAWGVEASLLLVRRGRAFSSIQDLIKPTVSAVRVCE